MKIKKIIYIVFFIITTVSCDSKINLNLPSVFSDFMILQRETEVSFWGKSSPNEKIEIRGTWGKSSSTKADKSGNWELKLITPSAGGPYEVVVNDSRNSIVFKDVLIQVYDIGPVPPVTLTVILPSDRPLQEGG